LIYCLISLNITGERKREIYYEICEGINSYQKARRFITVFGMALASRPMYIVGPSSENIYIF
jgi:hypothetical protein